MAVGIRNPLFRDSGGSADTTSNQVGTTQYKQISPTSDPAFAKLLEQIQAITPTSLPGINEITQQGMDSPLLQLVLGPAMQRLQAPQAQARQNLTEATRAAGGMRGSTYGQDMNKLVANQGLQQNDLMAQVIQQILGPLISGSLQSQQNSMLPGKSLTELLRTIAPQTLTGQTLTGQTGGGGSSGWENISPSLGLATPMSGGPGASPADRDAQLRGYPSAEAMRVQQMLGAAGGSRATPAGGVNSPAVKPYTPYLDPLSGGGSNITYNPVSGRYESVSPSNTGTFTPEQGGATYPARAPEWNPTTGAYQGGPAGDYRPLETVTEGWW